MTNQLFAKDIFKGNDQALTLTTKSSVKIDSEHIEGDLQLLFQQLVVANKAFDNVVDMFNFELCCYPPALFDASLMMKEEQKSGFADAKQSKLNELDQGTQPMKYNM